jgi:hypothetical protein
MAIKALELQYEQELLKRMDDIITGFNIAGRPVVFVSRDP